MAERMLGLLALFVLVGLVLISYALTSVHVYAAEVILPLDPGSKVGEWIDVASNIVAAAAVLAAVLPVPQKLTAGLGIVRKIVDLLAFNFGNAKNKKQ